ncbi:MAG: Flp pilus assembly complex ATPase component TadA [Deltaproteobacteria bacterium]|nr:Flp pilus assembly complex ATPase component TadA [Deltaproteobacteria bacterium]
MGLHNDSLAIYKEILSVIPANEAEVMQDIKKKIQMLEEEIHNIKEAQTEISSKDISMIDSVFSGKKTASKIIESASALIELGLIEEAVAEYKQLFQLEYPVNKIIPNLTDCLLRAHSPHKVVERIEEIVGKQGLGNHKKAQIKLILGMEMEKRGHRDLAHDLYTAALEIYPDNREIKERLDGVVSKISSGSRYDYLLYKNLVTAEQLQKGLLISKKMKKSVEFVLIDYFKVKKEDVGRSLSAYYGCPFKNFDAKIPVPVELISNLKKSFLLHDLWVPLSWEKNRVEILIDDPMDLRKTGQIRGLIKSKNIALSVGMREDIVQFINNFYEQRVDESAGSIMHELDMIPDISFEEEDTGGEDQEDMLDEGSSQVVKLVDQAIVSAYRKDASDIHVEPSPISNKTGIRFRMDGVCQDYMFIPNSMARGIISRLKIMAGLDIAERRLPQDGKIKFRRKGIPFFEMRLATIPTAGGYEDAVLRILAKGGPLKLDEMRLSERNKLIIERIITQPYGLILVVGPTGSGKTTTLHACIGQINKPGIKIWTAEDPIEITQQGLRQVEVKPKIGLDFARVMRSFLRADPDVIMIGEMRDFETASTGIEASLTGHLVFSTLHTNSAPETVVRLLDMGLNALNFSDAFLGVLAQRLVRRLCLKCREKYSPSKEEFEEIAAEYGEEYFGAANIKYTPAIVLYRPKGCEECSQTGYKGRMGIHELMEGTPEIKRLIKKQASSEELFIQAMKDGMTTLKQDGIKKVFDGLTDIKEVRRVCIQ